ncbi:MAG TPA: mechanosensitive ion channel family protein [Acidiferrobacter sp.]|nr:mechanosensitive ion channel family protein [Acidiferrobacter sp.]
MADSRLPVKHKVWRVLGILPWTTILWAVSAAILLVAVSYGQLHYKLPKGVISFVRVLIVAFVGLKIIRSIEGAMTRHRASKLEELARLPEGLELAWQDSVTGIYLIRLLLYAGLVLLAVFVVGGTFSGILVGGTLISVTLGVAGQSFFANFFGGLAVAMFKPFELGDHVQIVTPQFPMMPETYPHQLRAQGYRGVIRDINLFYSEMRLDDGQLFRIPNGIVITGGLIRSVPHEWARITFRFDVAVPADPVGVLRKLQAAAARHFRPRPEDPVPEAITSEAGVEVPEVAPPFGWSPPIVWLADISLTALSLEVRASVPQRLRDRAKGEFFAEILAVVFPQPAR